jgi:nitrogen regulatory protein P-II 1
MLSNVAGWWSPERRAPQPTSALRKVEAIVRPSRLAAVQTALRRYGAESFTVSEVKGTGHDRGGLRTYRGTVYAMDFFSRVKVEVVVPDAQAMPIAHAIADAAHTGRAGDGLVLVHAIAEAVSIGTGERGTQALGHESPAQEHEPLPLAM